MNSLDVVILIIVLISALIALNRGLIKEVLSIIGWVFGRGCRYLPFAVRAAADGRAY